MFSNALVGVLLVKLRGVFMGGWEFTQCGSVQFFNTSLNFNNVTLNMYVKKVLLFEKLLLLKLLLSISREVVPTNETVELISVSAI